jgi:hypothetical protein
MSGRIFCRSCGAENEADSGFCEQCGAALTPGGPAAQPAATAATPPKASGGLPALGRSKLTWLLGAVAIIALVLWRTGILFGDNLVDKLVATPLPADSYAGWSLEFAPSITPPDQPEPGEVGVVMAHLGRANNESAGFRFAVFRTPAQAEVSYRGSTTFDTTNQPTLTAAQLEQMRRLQVFPPGLTASCLSARAGALCHALVGRTVIFVSMEGSGVDGAVASLNALARHVAALGQ